MPNIRGSSSNVFGHSFVPLSVVQLARKAEILRFPYKNFFLTEKAIVAKLSLYLVEWMRTNISRSTSLYQQTFQFAEKEGKLPSLLVGNKGFFLESMLLKSTFRFPQFMKLL